MPYVSELQGRPVADVEGERIGLLQDVIATLPQGMVRPVIRAIVVKRPAGTLVVPFEDIAVFLAPAIPLNKRLQDIVPLKPTDDDLYLIRDVLDKQIIDTNGVRVVRVNDLELARLNGHFFVSNVDIGGLGVLRRLGVARVAQRVADRLGRKLPSGMIGWDGVELLPGNGPMRLKVPSDRLTDLHPADIAEIISDLSRHESQQFLEALDAETVAETLEEVEPEFQASLVETMTSERVADVLQEMSPDEAADLLAELPEDRSEEILNLMEDADARQVRKLLAYPEDSAGGIMTTEYVTVPPHLTAGQAIAHLRATAQEAENFFYLYVTDPQNHLLGVFSLQDLVLAKPQTPVKEFMQDRVITVNLLDKQDDVAQAVSKYNFLALPVVDEEGRLHGIVTADDALDKIIPTAWKKRLPRMYR
jgi:CBS domain-containing protein